VEKIVQYLPRLLPLRRGYRKGEDRGVTSVRGKRGGSSGAVRENKKGFAREMGKEKCTQ